MHLCDQLRRELRKAGLKIGFKKLGQLRRSVLVLWVSRYNLREAQYLAGHRSIHTTQGYQVGLLAELQEQVERYHPLEPLEDLESLGAVEESEED